MNDADKQVLTQMWNRKHLMQEMFCHATLVNDTEFEEYFNGAPFPAKRTYPAGTKVLVTMISRFGHVCVRARNPECIQHGYDHGMAPEDLKDYVPKW
jgi:hypothetical protein